ncbi:hypothetical protein FQN50_008846 [Emmonsiellopsis sp. PD_5]|nr:hypothetical protein FQN50_008846 [Emmonsiellopsis sp. PD_5]
MGRVNPVWVGDRFDDLTLNCSDGTKWEIGQKISEKACVLRGELAGSAGDIAEAQAVYHCHQVKGASVGLHAIMKVRLQVPPEFPGSNKPAIRAQTACDQPASPTRQEIYSLQYLNKRGCSVTPTLFNVESSYQATDDMPVPNGYMVFLVMEKVPGVPLVDFWKYSARKKEVVREAFRKALVELYSHYIDPADTQPGNIIYDEKTEKCYFVDYEEAYIEDRAEPQKFHKADYGCWGLN